MHPSVLLDVALSRTRHSSWSRIRHFMTEAFPLVVQPFSYGLVDHGRCSPLVQDGSHDTQRSNQAMQRTAGRSAIHTFHDSNPSRVCDARSRPRSLILFSLDA